MANKLKPTKKPVDKNKQIATAAEKKRKDRHLAEVCLSSDNVAADIVMAYMPGNPLDIGETAAVLRTHCDALAKQAQYSALAFA